MSFTKRIVGKEQIKEIEQASAFVSSTTKGIDNAIKEAAFEDVQDSPLINRLNIPEIPGVTPGLGAPISLAITPAVTQPSKPNSTGKYYQRFIKGQIEQTDVANNLTE